MEVLMHESQPKKVSKEVCPFRRISFFALAGKNWHYKDGVPSKVLIYLN